MKNITVNNEYIHLDFEQAKTKHLLFKSKLRSILYGAQLQDEAPVLSHFECTVGKWIYNHALKAYGHIPEMLELEKIHADIHISAKKLVTLYKENRVEEARRGLVEMEKIADHLVGLLAIVEHKLSVNPPKEVLPYVGLEANRVELNDLLIANDALDKKIRQQSGALLNERELLHNFFMQAAASFCILKSPEHLFELANASYLKIIGKKDIIGKTVRQVLPEIEGQGFIELLDKVYKTGEPFIGHEMLVRINKNENENPEDIYVDSIYQPLRSIQNEIEGIIIFAHDVTDLVIARKKAEESEARLHTLANSISQLAWMANADGWIYWYNDRWYEYTGTDLENMQGWGWGKVHHPDHIERVVNFVKEAWNSDTPFELTFPLKSKEGNYRWFLTRVYPVKNNEGKVIQWIGTNTDIDDQTKAIEQKDEFISIASHELKTPVTSLKGFTQILQMKFEKENDEQAVYLLSKMDKQVNKLTNLIVDLLDATKIENGQLKFNLEIFDLNSLINEIAEEMQRTTVNHKITIEGNGKTIVNGDRNRIGQVLINFISNAIKYSPTDEEIIISSMRNGTMVNVSVQDFGIGIPVEKQPLLFNRFYRASGKEEQTYPGLGLGLFISKEIIKRHNGNVDVKSAEGKGSTFSFSLPLDQAS